jgi:hypothetical protein
VLEHALEHPATAHAGRAGTGGPRGHLDRVGLVRGFRRATAMPSISGLEMVREEQTRMLRAVLAGVARTFGALQTESLVAVDTLFVGTRKGVGNCRPQSTAQAIRPTMPLSGPKKPAKQGA